MSEINLLVSTIRDSKLCEVVICYQKGKSKVILKLSKNNKPNNVILKGIKEIIIFDDSVQQEYIGMTKGIQESPNSYWLSLDPYNDRVNQIEEKDNYVFKFTEFQIVRN